MIVKKNINKIKKFPELQVDDGKYNVTSKEKYQ